MYGWQNENIHIHNFVTTTHDLESVLTSGFAHASELSSSNIQTDQQVITAGTTIAQWPAMNCSLHGKLRASLC